ncbi:MAG: DMT family transporter [Pseudomonadota bacterium]
MSDRNYALIHGLSRSRLWAAVLLLIMGITWGAAVSLGKIAAEGGGHPLGLNFWQGLIGGLTLLALAAVRRRLPSIRPKAMGFYVICGILGSSAPGILLFFILPKISAGVVSITFATVPLITYGLSYLLGIERLSILRCFGILLGLAAVGLIVVPEESLPEAGQALWVLLLLACATSYALEAIVIDKWRPDGEDAIALTTGMLLVGAGLLIPFMALFDGYLDIFVPWRTAEWALFAMAVTSSLAYAIYLYVVQIAGPVYASQTAYIVTFSGVLWGMALFEESHSGFVWAALALMLVGLTLVRPRVD